MVPKVHKFAKQDGAEEEHQGVDGSGITILVRATDVKKKISTLLSARDHHRFQMAYATVLKAHMDTLEKREKKGKKEKKEKKEKKATEGPGPDSKGLGPDSRA